MSDVTPMPDDNGEVVTHPPVEGTVIDYQDAPVLAKFGVYAKTVAALIVGVLGWGAAVVASDPTAITASEWIQLGTVGAVAIGVYAVPNNIKAKV